MTRLKFNPRNAGKTGKKRSKAFCKAQSLRLLGLMKSPETRKRMRRAAVKRWADPAYRKKHSIIMKKRWAIVHKAEEFLSNK